MTKVLIADDDLEIQELLKFTFENEEYEAFIAKDGESAWELTKSIRPDIVVLDINMPKLSGFEVCEKIRQDPDTWLTPIVMLTSLSKTKDKLTGIKLGADEYISKPFEPLEIVARVEGLLKRINATADANSITRLPGAVMIEKDLKDRLASKQEFALICTDIDKFKEYNEKHGFENGDNVIKLLGLILRNAIVEDGNRGDFLGHFGGDDFVIFSSKDKIDPICEKIINSFDELIKKEYERLNININAADGVMTLSVGASAVKPDRFNHHAQVFEYMKELIKRIKSKGKSSYVID